MTIKITGRVLTASTDDRTITGLLLPYGEQGSTSVGKVTAEPGALTIPDDPGDVHLNVEHDATRPIGKAVAIDERDEGLVATFRVAATRAGDDVLEEAREGLRACLSVEIDEPVIRAGRLVGGRLSGAGAVVRPAFPSAQLVAADHGDDPDEAEDENPDDTLPTDDDQNEPDDQEDRMTARLSKPATRPGGLTAAKPRAQVTETGPSAHVLYASLAAAGQEPSALHAALTQVSQANVFDKAQVPQYLGEVWSGVTYEQEFAPLIGHADLTSQKIIGWRFKEGKTPVVGAWTGGGTQVPTNAVEAEVVDMTASRLAAGWDVDRIYRDFPNPEFWAAFHRLSNESYAKNIDLAVRDFLVNPLNAVDLEYDPASIPTGVGLAAAKIVKGALALKSAQKGRATFAVLGLDLYEEWLYTRQEDSLPYLAPNLGLTQGDLLNITVVGTDQVADGTCRVGVRQVATLHELGGASPLRVSTEDVAKGNLTEALFGYYGIFRHDAKAIVNVVEDTTP